MHVPIALPRIIVMDRLAPESNKSAKYQEPNCVVTAIKDHDVLFGRGGKENFFFKIVYEQTTVEINIFIYERMKRLMFHVLLCSYYFLQGVSRLH